MALCDVTMVTASWPVAFSLGVTLTSAVEVWLPAVPPPTVSPSPYTTLFRSVAVEPAEPTTNEPVGLVVVWLPVNVPDKPASPPPRLWIVRLSLLELGRVHV